MGAVGNLAFHQEVGFLKYVLESQHVNDDHCYALNDFFLVKNGNNKVQVKLLNGQGFYC